MKRTSSFLIPLLALLSSPFNSATAEEEVAKKLANPVSDLISVPIQTNFDFGIGPGEGTRFVTNIQPVVPFRLNDDWNLISRTILPVIEQNGIVPGGAADVVGLGDTVQSFFFAPSNSDPILGFGPALLLPTATDPLLGTEKWGLGPTGVILKQSGPWTYGVLANHLWDIGGDDSRDHISSTFLQPFLAHVSPSATTLALNMESSYNWRAEQWTIPVNFVVSQLLKVGEQPVQVFAGARYYAEAPGGGPEWGVRFGATLLFPAR